ncbi:single-stranded-DNA-specific exonuclease RecJ [Acidithiobacillus caldus]|uniref:Single-stranded-DNA-specific exonuclease RecJ n=1 Tax=Acidithiobacillus caldus (strain SM-1) TaxID=990288 RepID=F9ZTE3_ACICS|nr:single-stranded-DNA-specific exonuclease RecJ [Acidithiobacillus caldus]AEK56964.1 Single-stranded-DNA-specific exonuclease recJ [Acidithiobacillus caldus SM-1]AUW31758.1 single-stranded-DNA-specific exonuclease RecJ [Acidithiobacillus caldus]MBU2782783.1 single-stranded-DNA-specific exonuclease RecJ [Acidithiobacillus caldus]QER44514.1 single-stranded-DNA-specific exonuclease RecJ [Acidithiobacillus caldus]
MSRWQQRPLLAPEILAEAKRVALDPVLARLYAARAVRETRQLRLDVEQLSPGEGDQGLLGLGAAAELLADAVRQQRVVCIVGDYDCDGATATALLHEALSLCGARALRYVVPDRFRWGYGLTPELVAQLPADTEIVVTVDNGITSVDGVAAAKARNLQVIITDHHLPGAVLPAADAIVNPRQPGCPFPWKSSSGVAVAFYLAAAVRRRLLDRGYLGAGAPHFGQLWDLVALGTVADVVALEHNNRILVQQGLKRLRSGRARPGLAALLECAGVEPAAVTAATLGFTLAPRINAAGRLEDMGLGIRLLLSQDRAEAAELARTLDELNRQRRAIEAQMSAAAQRIVDDLPDCGHNLGLCVFRPEWHAGVIGIVAGRLRERYHRPAFAFAPVGDGFLQGSGRSIAGLHLRDSLADCAARAPHLLERFGGHAAAAGLRLRRAHLDEFVALWNTVLAERLTTEDLEESVFHDGPLESSSLDLELARRLEAAGPWGNGFPEPLFWGRFRICERRALSGGHWRLHLDDGAGRRFEAIRFRSPELPPGPWVEALYVPEVNRYAGSERLQLRLHALRNGEENGRTQ